MIQSALEICLYIVEMSLKLFQLIYISVILNVIKMQFFKRSLIKSEINGDKNQYTLGNILHMKTQVSDNFLFLCNL